MPYKIVKVGYKWFVFDNYDKKLPGSGFKSRKSAEKQRIAVALKQSIKEKKPINYFFV